MAVVFNGVDWNRKDSGTIQTALKAEATEIHLTDNLSVTKGLTFADGTRQSTAAVGGGGYWTASSTDIYNNNSGNVGIGTSSPYFKMDFAGNVRIQGAYYLYFGGTGSSGNDTNLYRDSENVLKTDDAFVALSGSFNPSTTPSDAVSLLIAQPGSSGTRDSHALITRGTSYDTGGHNADWKNYVNVTSNAGASTWILQSRVDSGSFATRLSVTDGGSVSTGELHLTDNVSLTKGVTFADGTRQTTAAVSGTNYWTLSSTDIYSNNAGNVGVGTSTPYFKLDVGGSVRIQGSNCLYFNGTGASDNDTNLYCSAANTLKTDDSLIVAGASLSVTGASGNTFVVDTNTLVVDASNHRVGIGSASPGSLLTVGSSSQFTVGSTGPTTITPSADATALTLTGTSVASSNLAYLNTKNTSGTVLNIAYGAAATLAGSLVGQSLDLNTNVTNAAQSVTGIQVKMPPASAASANTFIAVNVPTAGAIVNSSGTSTWTGLNLQMPAITQSSGTLTSIGVKITGGTVTSGTAYALVADATAGNVGIGTTIPYFRMDLAGDIRIQGTGANKLWFGGTGASDNDVNLYRSGADTLRTDDTFIAQNLTLIYGGGGVLTFADGTTQSTAGGSTVGMMRVIDLAFSSANMGGYAESTNSVPENAIVLRTIVQVTLAFVGTSPQVQGIVYNSGGSTEIIASTIPDLTAVDQYEADSMARVPASRGGKVRAVLTGTASSGNGTITVVYAVPLS